MEGNSIPVTWRKARASGSNGGNCVEVGTATGSPAVLVRDTKNRDGGHLTVSREAFGRFLAGIKGIRELDDPPAAEER